MYVMFQLRPFTVHNVFPCFYGPNKVIIIITIIIILLLLLLLSVVESETGKADDSWFPDRRELFKPVQQYSGWMIIIQ